MYAQELGFVSSWRMLTRDKGWIKPMLVLTLLGWIPILGQIAFLGYGLEWARLTAWGVDAAPKQRNVDYGKVLSTGGRAFLVNLSLGFACALVLQILFPGSLVWLASGLVGMDVPALTLAASGVTASLIMLVATVFIDTFLRAAMMRATVYDGFEAGWRLDRLMQMISRDPGGFFKTWLVSAIGALVTRAYAIALGMLGFVIVMGGAMGIAGIAGFSGVHSEEYLIHQLLTWGAGPALLFVILAIGAAFVGGVISTTMGMVSMNAMGQWFCRFEVFRWGLSGAPLPDDVPRRHGAARGGASPVRPASPVPPPAPDGVDPSGTVGAADSVADSASGVTSVSPVSSEPSAAPDPVAPLDAPAQATQLEPSAIPMPPVSGGAPAPQVSALDEAVTLEAEVDEGAAAATEAPACGEGEIEPESDIVPKQTEDIRSKEPIPLGPVSNDPSDEEDEGPIVI